MKQKEGDALNNIRFGRVGEDAVRGDDDDLLGAGIVEDVDTVRGKLTVKVQMFLGREMPVEVDLDQVEKVEK